MVPEALIHNHPGLNRSNQNASNTSKPIAKISDCEKIAPSTSESGPRGAALGYQSLSGFKLTAKNGAGDTFELTAFRYESWSASVSGRSAGSAEEARGTPSESQNRLQELWKAVQRELKGQQRDLLRALLAGRGDGAGEAGKAGNGGLGAHEAFRRLTVVVLEERYGLREEGPDGSPESGEDGEAEGPLDIDPYWNAENTSERIVQFAMGFAALHGKDAEFGDRIRAAVEEGFRQAGALTGPLPGAAGKLNRDTHALTFEKLEMRLVEAQARPYNQGAQTIPMTA